MTRNLGSTEAKADLTLPNEIEFSLSANVGLTFREDVEPRTRKIGLVLFEENPNGRDFAKPDLHGWVLEHRADLLSAVGALVKRWIDEGCPSGPSPFNSFPEWSRIVGGIQKHGAGRRLGGGGGKPGGGIKKNAHAPHHIGGGGQ